MKKYLTVILSVCTLLFVAGCGETKQPSNNNNEPYLHIFIRDTDEHTIYSDLTEVAGLPLLSIYEEYIILLDAGPGARFLPYENVYINYDEENIKIVALEDVYGGEMYSLRGLKDCINSVVEFYTLKHKYDSEGVIISSEIDLSCSVYINFSGDIGTVVVK